MGHVLARIRDTLPLAALLALLTLPALAGSEDCLVQDNDANWKAATSIVSYPNNQQDYFEITLQIGLFNNYRADLQGPTGPITANQELHYCQSIDWWARKLYVSSEGLYRIRRADFWSVDYEDLRADISSTESPFQVKWYLGWAQDAAFWPRVLGLTSPVFMSDFPIFCIGSRNVENGHLTYPPSFRCDANLLQVPGDFECEDFMISGEPGWDWAFCTDGGGQLVDPSPLFLGGVLHHEGGHFFFRMPDERDKGEAVSACFSEFATQVANDICEGDEDGTIGYWDYDDQPYDPIGGETSVMLGGGFRHNFCDDTTHLHRLALTGLTLDNEDINGGDLNPSMWAILREEYPAFNNGNVHQDGVFNSLGFFDLPMIDCFFHDNALSNDPLMVVDRSGSMNFSLPTDQDYRAIDAAKEAAVHLYNHVPAGFSSGIITFNDVTTVEQAYAPVGPLLHVGNLNWTAAGLTDIEGAIVAAKDIIKQAQLDPEKLSASMILLSDGKPTAPIGRTPQEHWEFTVKAAKEACEEGIPPIKIHTIAFGDADVELLHDIAEACKGNIWINGGNGTPGEKPLDYKESMTRAGYRARLLPEVLHEREPILTTPMAHSFFVPDSSKRLEFTWMAKVSSEVDVGGTPIACDFDELSFELEDPSGVVTSADLLSPVGPIELDYGVRTARVDNPDTGVWIARAQAPGNCLTVQPELIWIATVRNHWYSARIDIADNLAPRNTPVVVETALEYAERPLTGVSIQLELLNDGAVTPLFPSDDGLGADQEAGDGIYTATIDGLLAGDSAGGLTVRGVFESFAGVSAVAPMELDLMGYPAAHGPARSPGDAVLLVEESLLRRECCDVNGPGVGCTAFCADGVNQTRPTPNLSRGGLHRLVEVEICGLPLVPDRTQIGFGPGLKASDLSTSYDPVADCGILTFNVDIDADATVGPRRLQVESGRRLEKEDGGLVVCTADGLPAVDTTDVALEACGADVTVMLPAARTALPCGEPGPIQVDAWIQTLGGVPVVPPTPIDPVDPTVTLLPGLNEILWQATDPSSGAFGQSVQTASVTSIACSPAGRVPDGLAVAGTPLTVDKATPGFIQLSWGDSCLIADVDYAIYEGPLGSFSDHVPVFCSTGGTTTHALIPSSGNTYYLVVPHNGPGQEGSYGTDSDGNERLPNLGACAPQSIGSCLPM